MITLDPLQLFDADFGPRMVSVTPPDGVISPASKLIPKSMGKAPGRLTQAGWTGVDVNSLADRCHDFRTAKLWQDWGANIGLAGGDGYVIIDNDQGKEFSDVLRSLFPNAPRRYVSAPKHERDAFFVKVLDFVGEGSDRIANRDMLFRRGVNTAKLQVLAQGKQAVIYGIHRDTRGPYSWDRKLRDIRDIPEMSEREFRDTIRNLMVKLADIGWTTTAPVSPVSRATNRNANTSAPPSSPSDKPDVDSIIADARAYLDLIPNRELADGNPSKTKADFWLDAYENWTTLAYALAALMGTGVFDTPQAEDLWIDWSGGRPQEQNPISVWQSVIKQPIRFGPMALVKILRELDALPPGDFPPLDPNDPALQPSPTPKWDNLQDAYSLFKQGGFIEMSTAQILPRQAFSDLFADQAKTLAQELGYKKRPKPPSVADLFVGQSTKPIVTQVIYAPGDPPIQGSELNKWRPTNVPAIPVAQSEVQFWLDHVEFVLDSATERERFVKWSAFVAQYPELKPNWHWLIMSLEGLGKHGLTEPLKAAVGTGVSLGVSVRERNNWNDTELTHVTDNFNRSIETKLLIIGETGQPRSGQLGNDVWTRFKPILAAPPPYLEVNEKNIPRYKVLNRQAVLLFSNETNPIQTEEGQRRVHVINSRHVVPKADYTPYFDWLHNGGAEKAASYLLTYPLSDADKRDFIGGKAPNSVAKSALAALNKPPALTELEDIIEHARSGSELFACLLATAHELADHIGQRVHKPTPQAVSGWLLEMERRKEGVRRVKIDLKKPHQCGLVGPSGAPKLRLWALGEKARDGRDWDSFSHADLLALYEGKKLTPRRGKAKPFPAEDEKI